MLSETNPFHTTPGCGKLRPKSIAHANRAQARGYCPWRVSRRLRERRDARDRPPCPGRPPSAGSAIARRPLTTVEDAGRAEPSVRRMLWVDRRRFGDARRGDAVRIGGLPKGNPVDTPRDAAFECCFCGGRPRRRGPTRWQPGGRLARPRSRLADDPFGGRPPNIAAAVAASSSRLLSPGAAPADRPCHPHRSVPTPSLPSLPSPSLPSPSPPSPPPPLAFFAAAALAAASSPPPRRLRRSVSRVARRLRHVWRCDAPVCNATTLVVGPPVLIR